MNGIRAARGGPPTRNRVGGSDHVLWRKARTVQYAPIRMRASRRASSLTNLQGAGGWSRPNIGWSEHRKTECSFADRPCRQCRIRSTFTAEGKSSASMFCHFSSSFAIVLLQLGRRKEHRLFELNLRAERLTVNGSRFRAESVSPRPL